MANVLSIEHVNALRAAKGKPAINIKDDYEEEIPTSSGALASSWNSDNLTFNDLEDPEFIAQDHHDGEADAGFLEDIEAVEMQEDLDDMLDEVPLTNRHANPAVDPLGRYMVERACAFAGKYDPLLESMANDRGDQAVDLLISDVEQGILADGLAESAGIARLAIMRLCRQICQDGFFELMVKESRAQRREDLRTMPAAQPTYGTELKARIAALKGQRRYGIDSTSDGGFENKHDLSQDGTPLQRATFEEIEETMKDMHFWLSSIHNDLFELQYGTLPDQPIGYMSFQDDEDGSWLEVLDFDTAFQMFKLKNEDRRQAKDAAKKQAVLNRLAARKAASNVKEKTGEHWPQYPKNPRILAKQ